MRKDLNRSNVPQEEKERLKNLLIANNFARSDVYDYATLLCTVRAGESADGFFYFDSDYCTVSEGSSLNAIFAAQDATQTPVGIWTLTL